MPIYEYRCNACGKLNSVLVRSYSSTAEPACGECGSADMTRAVSRPAIIRSSGGSDSGSLQTVDPRRAIQQMGDMYERTGKDPGAGFREVVNRVAAGDSPHELKEAVKEARTKDAGTGG